MRLQVKCGIGLFLSLEEGNVRNRRFQQMLHRSYGATPRSGTYFGDIESSSLGRYSRDVAQHELLTPETEKKAAKEIEDAEVACWIAMFASREEAERILDHLTASISQPRKTDEEEMKRADRDLLQRAQELRQCIPADQPRWDELTSEFALQLCRFDFDKSLIAEIRDLTKSSTHRAYLARISHSFRLRKKARDAFVNANLRLVISIARRFLGLGRVAINDLVQEGNCGLLLAVDRFDYRLGYRFSTYASWWIQHSIVKGVSDRGRMIRFPVHVLEAMQQVTRLQQDTVAQFGRECTYSEIADALGFSLEKVQRVLECFRISASYSLNRSVDEESSATFLDLLEDTDGESPHDALLKKQEARDVRALLAVLTPREQRVIRLRFDLDGTEDEQTLQQIGNQYDFSRERIRQIQEHALKKMRHRLEDK